MIGPPLYFSHVFEVPLTSSSHILGSTSGAPSRQVILRWFLVLRNVRATCVKEWETY